MNYLKRKLVPLSGFFKGGGGGATTSVTQNFSPEEAARRAQVMDEAQKIYEQTAPNISSASYPGARPVPFSMPTLMAQELLANYALNGAQNFANLGQGSAQFGLQDVLYPQTNPALEATITAAQRPVVQQFTDAGGVLSQIRDSATGAGQYGGTRQGIAEGIAMGRLGQTLGDISSNIATEGYKSGLDTFSRTMALLPALQQMGTNPATYMSAIGQQQEGLAQENENYAANARMWELNAPWAPLQNYASIVYGGANPSTTTTQIGNMPRANPILGGIGGAATGAYIGSMIPGVGTGIGAGLGLLAGLFA